MRETDVIIVGGSAAGATAAITARRHYPEKEVLVVRQEKQVPIPCGIPYVFGTLGSAAKNIIPDAMLEKEGIKIVVETVKALDPPKQMVSTTAGEIGYERLILATGSLPVRLPVAGAEKDGAFPIFKDIAHLEALQKRIQTATHVVVIGGGFIGIEFADEIQKLGGKTVTVLEIAPHCLSLAYDEEFCVEMEEMLKSRGVNIRTNVKVVEIAGDKQVQAVRLSDGTSIPAEVVIFGIGAVPNIEIAKTAGLKLGPTGAIAVDRAMRTSCEHIFACGDCAEKVSFFGGRPSPLRLASIATLEARIAGANLYDIRREHDGTVGVWSTAIGNLAMATAGLTETTARQNGYNCVAVIVEGPNRHPGGMPGGASTKLKLVFEKNTGVFLGGQVRGNESVGELINAISACIQKRMTAEDIAMFQMGTHPALTASPIAYHLVNAAEIAIARMRAVKQPNDTERQ
ncbi:MAG: FAD-dependent oxidoreductase [Kiritimatiellae bacterium]|nr:FAD-dependent oxidoreductase [Kiritimatiellia bacterium]